MSVTDEDVFDEDEFGPGVSEENVNPAVELKERAIFTAIKSITITEGADPCHTHQYVMGMLPESKQGDFVIDIYKLVVGSVDTVITGRLPSSMPDHEIHPDFIMGQVETLGGAKHFVLLCPAENQSVVLNPVSVDAARVYSGTVLCSRIPGIPPKKCILVDYGMQVWGRNDLDDPINACLQQWSADSGCTSEALKAAGIPGASTCCALTTVLACVFMKEVDLPPASFDLVTPDLVRFPMVRPPKAPAVAATEVATSTAQNNSTAAKPLKATASAVKHAAAAKKVAISAAAAGAAAAATAAGLPASLVAAYAAAAKAAKENAAAFHQQAVDHAEAASRAEYAAKEAVTIQEYKDSDKLEPINFTQPSQGSSDDSFEQQPSQGRLVYQEDSDVPLDAALVDTVSMQSQSSVLSQPESASQDLSQGSQATTQETVGQPAPQPQTSAGNNEGTDLCCVCGQIHAGSRNRSCVWSADNLHLWHVRSGGRGPTSPSPPRKATQPEAEVAYKQGCADKESKQPSQEGERFSTPRRRRHLPASQGPLTSPSPSPLEANHVPATEQPSQGRLVYHEDPDVSLDAALVDTVSMQSQSSVLSQPE